MKIEIGLLCSIVAIFFSFFYQLPGQEFIILSSRNDSVVFPDFDDWVTIFANAKAKALQREVIWVENYGNHSLLRKYPEFSQYKLTLTLGDFKYGKPKVKKQHTVLMDVRQYKNRSPSRINCTMLRQVKSHVDWQMTLGMKSTNALFIDARLPDNINIESFGGLEPIKINIQSRNKQRMELREKTMSPLTVEIPSMKVLTMELNVTVDVVEVPFQVDVYIDGHIAVWYRKLYRKHRLWFYPACMLTNKDFHIRGNGLVFRTTGIFRGSFNFALNADNKMHSLND